MSRCQCRDATAHRATRGLGVRRGDWVAFLGINQPMFLLAFFATVRLGAIFVPLTGEVGEVGK